MLPGHKRNRSSWVGSKLSFPSPSSSSPSALSSSSPSWTEIRWSGARPSTETSVKWDNKQSDFTIHGDEWGAGASVLYLFQIGPSIRTSSAVILLGGSERGRHSLLSSAPNFMEHCFSSRCGGSPKCFFLFNFFSYLWLNTIDLFEKGSLLCC